MSHSRWGWIVLWCGAVSVCLGTDLRIDPVNYGLITQKQFDDFVLEVGTAISFTPMAPAKTLGWLGFDVGAELVTADFGSHESWKYFVEDRDTFGVMPLPRLHGQKGLPWGIDVGGMLAALPDSNVRVWGLEAKKAFLDDGELLPLPAVAGRIGYSRLEGVDDIDLETLSLDLLVSKDIWVLTPYAGLSYLRIEGRQRSSLLSGIDDVTRSNVRTLVGVQWLAFPLTALTGEIVFGDVPQFGLKGALRF